MTNNIGYLLAWLQQALVESEGRWPRICALALPAHQQSEVRHVL